MLGALPNELGLFSNFPDEIIEISKNSTQESKHSQYNIVHYQRQISREISDEFISS